MKTASKSARSSVVLSTPREDDAAVTQLRKDVLAHLKSLRLPAANGGMTPDKMLIRHSHSHQRSEVSGQEWQVIGPKIDELIENFADGTDIVPSRIEPELVPVVSGKPTGDLFRLATLLWSVPVSKGYGRRMRFLVRDKYNGKLIGIFALGDPVFNLSCRDQWIGWDVHARQERLVNILDAYVVGAVPPYNEILGGKLVASLIGSAEVSHAFTKKYGRSEGIISGEKKAARLALVTVTSALGRSSLYNRLSLKDEGGDSLVQLLKIGETRGYGHFQLSNGLFERIRELLIREGHPYANAHGFGQGPNWRIRVLRVGLKRLGLDDELIHHGIQREVFAMPLASNFREYLCHGSKKAKLHRPPASTIAQAALRRWVLPRAERNPEYMEFRREQLLERIFGPGYKKFAPKNLRWQQGKFDIDKA